MSLIWKFKLAFASEVLNLFNFTAWSTITMMWLLNGVEYVSCIDGLGWDK
jgi:hypothetical protein